jgi:leucyl-tRNA synthetase
VGFKEPFRALFTQGMIYKDGAKMSKSRGNVVSVDEMCNHYGADTARCFILFMGPPEQDAEWREAGVEGIHRFLGRIWRVITGHLEDYDPAWREKIGAAALSPAGQALRRKTHQTVKRVIGDLDRFHFHTALSALMEMVTEMRDPKDTREAGDLLALSEACENLILLLSPFAPHMACELWQQMGKTEELYFVGCPTWEESIAKEEQITLVVQVNGKVRDRITVAADTAEAELKATALASEKVKQHLEGKTPRQVIVVAGKLVNIVV